MLTCGQCGTENQLGRVFCSNCGGKLDLTHMSSEEVADSQRRGVVARFWWTLPAALLLVTVILFGLALWPRPKMIGQDGVRTDGTKVKSFLQALNRARPGPKGTQYLAEKDINAYFTYHKRPEALKATVRMRIVQGQVHVRMTKQATIDLKLFQWCPMVSYDVMCKPKGGRLVPIKAARGHLAMSGPMKKSTVKKVRDVLAAQSEWKDLANIQKIKLSTEKKKLYIEYEKQ